MNDHNTTHEALPIGDLDADQLRDWIGRHVKFQTDSDLDMFTVWILHTWRYRDSWNTPRILLTSAQHGAGKSTALRVLQHLAANPRKAGASITEPVLRDSAAHGRTLLIDEFGKWSKTARNAIAGILNDGFDSEGVTPFNVQVGSSAWEVQDVSTFAPVAAAGLLQEIDQADDVASRWIALYLRRASERPQSTKSGAYRRARDEWRQRIEQWAATAELPDPDDLPNGSRFDDKFSPLRQIASALGGDWPARIERVVEAEEIVSEERDGERTLMPHELALIDSFRAWQRLEEDREFVLTRVLLTLLQDIEPQRWGESKFHRADGTKRTALTARRYANMVRQFGITPTRDHMDGVRGNGYRRADFIPHWWGDYAEFIGAHLLDAA